MLKPVSNRHYLVRRNRQGRGAFSVQLTAFKYTKRDHQILCGSKTGLHRTSERWQLATTLDFASPRRFASLRRGTCPLPYLMNHRRTARKTHSPNYVYSTIAGIPQQGGGGVPEQCDRLMGGSRLLHSGLFLSVQLLSDTKRFWPPYMGIPPYWGTPTVSTHQMKETHTPE